MRPLIGLFDRDLRRVRRGGQHEVGMVDPVFAPVGWELHNIRGNCLANRLQICFV
jgi:hypothetical protein